MEPRKQAFQIPWHKKKTHEDAFESVSLIHGQVISHFLHTTEFKVPFSAELTRIWLHFKMGWGRKITCTCLSPSLSENRALKVFKCLYIVGKFLSLFHWYMRKHLLNFHFNKMYNATPGLILTGQLNLFIISENKKRPHNGIIICLIRPTD